MATAEFLLNVPAVEITDDFSEEEDGSLPHVDSTVLLADAIRKMDGLIGDFKPEPPCRAASDPVVVAIMDSCTRLYHLMRQWDSQHSSTEAEGEAHASSCIASDVKQLIISWLANERMGSPVEVDQLRQDKEELLNQVVALQQEQEASAVEKEKLSKKVEELERRCVEKDHQNRSLTEEIKVTKSALHSKEVELRHLKDQLQAAHKVKPPLTSRPADRQKHVTIADPSSATANGGEGETKIDRTARKGSFKIFKKGFGRKKRSGQSVEEPQPSTPAKPSNARAAAFYAKDSKQLADWFGTIGLDMYSDLLERNVSSGEQLVTMVTANSYTVLAQIGIVSTLHCKKLRLAVEDAVAEVASPLRDLDHHWVAAWLSDIGLPQYQRKFLDARIDGQMLNLITADNLSLLDIDAPFHVASIKRAIQALRKCGYCGDYLADGPPGSASKKLLHWSSRDVAQWIRSIELEEYVEGLEEAGVHGALMLLDVHFTSESLAAALGIPHTMGLVRKHLSRKFLELVGPIAAQKKYDAMQSKTFVALDPTDSGRAGHRVRSRSMGSRRGRTQEAQEVLLCPLDEFPAARGVEQNATPPLVASPSPIES